MWDLPRPGHEPVSPALAGKFLTTVPPGKPYFFFKSFSYLGFKWRVELTIQLTSCLLIIIGFFHVSLLLLTAVLYIMVYIFHDLTIHSPSDGHLYCFQLLTTPYRSAMNILYVHLIHQCENSFGIWVQKQT